MKNTIKDFLEIVISFVWIGSTITTVICIGALVLKNSGALPILYIALPLCFVTTFPMIRYGWIKKVWMWLLPF